VDERTGAVHAGGDAAIAIGAALPGIGPLARVVGSVPPVRWGIGRAYDLVARNRHRIGRWLRLEGPACDVPR
jgi:predicted DCC family thiol-disulfide oxidoreductase YuxK